MLENAIRLIESQQGSEDKSPHRWMLGEQIKDICRRDPAAAELVAQDLENPELSLAKLEQKFDEFAKKGEQRNGSQGSAIILPKQGERLIREFFGIPEPASQAPPAPSAPGKVLSLFDLLGEE